ncbi:MAG: FKBP-type peptidyl-prolyl cis-trans isomerase [Lysobacteraceae bacterium]|jgi:FKBP-type peptidyl-prolyl cis-trans isomerase FkpA
MTALRRRLFLRFLPLVAAGVMLAACAPDPGPPPGGTPADLEVSVLRPGTGALARGGDIVQVHYTGWLYDERAAGRKGTEFDGSRGRGEPLVFPLGTGRVIRGWDEGVAGMRVGEIRELAIPADLAYGRRGAGDVIPPNQPLLFEVELVGVQAAE